VHVASSCVDVPGRTIDRRRTRSNDRPGATRLWPFSVSVRFGSISPRIFSRLFFDSPGLTIPGARLTLGCPAPVPAFPPAAPAPPPLSGVDFLNHEESSESDEVLIATVAAEAGVGLAPQTPFAAAAAVAPLLGSYANSEKIPAAPPPGGLEDMQWRGPPPGCAGLMG